MEKKVLIISGTHGDESGAVADCYVLKKQLEEQNFDAAEVTFFQAWNTTGLANECREWVEPDEDPIMDLNRCLVDTDTESREDKIEKLKSLIDKNDIIIDVHNSPNCSNIITINNDLYATDYYKFAKEKNIPFILRQSNANTIKKYAYQKGKVAFTVELGAMYMDTIGYKANYVFLLKLICSVLDYLNNGGSFGKSEMTLPSTYDCLTINAHSTGCLINVDSVTSSKKAREVSRIDGTEFLSYYTLGRVIANVVDVHTDEIKEVITAPCNGWLHAATNINWVTPDSQIGYFQPDV